VGTNGKNARKSLSPLNKSVPKTTGDKSIFTGDTGDSQFQRRSGAFNRSPGRCLVVDFRRRFMGFLDRGQHAVNVVTLTTSSRQAGRFTSSNWCQRCRAVEVVTLQGSRAARGRGGDAGHRQARRSRW
jgi:hypothetical protein